MFFLMAIGLYTSRIILDKLGAVDFGIYNVVGGFVTMFSVISGTMTSASQRFLSFEIGQENKGNVKEVFNTIIYIHIFLALIVLVCGETIGLWFLNSKMNYPIERSVAVNWTFQLSLITFMLNVVSVPYNAALIAYERMKAFAYIGILDAIMKLLICFIIIRTPFDRLITYAWLLTILAISIQIIYMRYCHCNLTSCRFIGMFDKKTAKSIFSFVGWNTIGALACVAKDQGVNVVLNLFFGPVVNAACGIAHQVLGKIQGFVSNFQLALNPQIIQLYSKNERELMFKLVFRGAKFSYLMMLLLTVPIIVEAKLILGVWLKTVPQYTVIFLQLILINAVITSISNPLIMSMHASGKVRDYQIFVGSLSLLTLPCVYISFQIGFEPYYALIIVILIELLCHIARLLMLKRIMDFPAMSFLKEITSRFFIISTITLLLSFSIYRFVDIIALRFLLIAIESTLCVSILGFFIACNDYERSFFKKKIIIALNKIR